MHKDTILIVDDEKDMREFLEIMLRKEGYEVKAFSSASQALEYCRESRYDLVITDLRMPGMDGVAFLKSLKEMDPEALVIMVTAYASVDNAVEAIKAGAHDYFTKPFNIVEVKQNIRNALKIRNLERVNRLLKKDLDDRTGVGGLIGSSARMSEIYALIKNVARSKTNVFITGESGTGKELVARAIHSESDRAAEPFVAVNCGAIPENLLESELFGHQKGAFTGAVSNRIGLAEQADGGTLFLDEITELPLHLQVKLLRFIQERNFRRVGGSTDIQVDIRLIAASNRDVEAEVKAGRFREDLFYRLNVIRVNLPALRDRKADIAALIAHFIDKYNKALGKSVRSVSEDAMKAAIEADYPGNVRELENVIERAITIEDTQVLTLKSLYGDYPSKSVAAVNRNGGTAAAVLTSPIPPDGIDLEKTVEAFERSAIQDALVRTNGVKKKAAELLGMTFRSLRYKLNKYGIKN